MYSSFDCVHEASIDKFKKNIYFRIIAYSILISGVLDENGMALFAFTLFSADTCYSLACDITDPAELVQSCGRVRDLWCHAAVMAVSGVLL